MNIVIGVVDGAVKAYLGDPVPPPVEVVVDENDIPF